MSDVGDIDHTLYEWCVNLAHLWHDRSDWDGYVYFWTMRMGIESPEEHAAYQRYKDESVLGDPLAPRWPYGPMPTERYPSGTSEGAALHSTLGEEWAKPALVPDNRQARRARAALARKCS